MRPIFFPLSPILVSPLLTETTTLSETMLDGPTPLSVCEVRAEGLSGGGAIPFQPKPFQEVMLARLRTDMRNRISPWLGLAAPMQTGKSAMTKNVIEMIFEELGNDTDVIVLSSARIITEQLLGDLRSQFNVAVSRFDGLVKDKRRRITVASTVSMANHLDRFSTQRRTVIINDQAFSTQSDSCRSIYTHFGLGEVVGEGASSRLVPRQGDGLVIGYSGTGGGLEGYHVSAHLDLLSAIKLRLVRHLRGERIDLRVSFEESHAGEERIITWAPTQTNAEMLAEIYGERLLPHYGKTLVYVSTIAHGRLLQKVLKEKCGSSHPVHFVHSDEDMNDGEFLSTIDAWKKDGGALISIRRVARGFRAGSLGPVGAVFHTYQSDSPELFAERTGRAWAFDKSDLLVLEAVWNGRGSFVNLARLLGLVDYPGQSFSTRTLKKKQNEQEAKENRRRELLLAVERGDVSPEFAGIPLLESWRSAVSALLSEHGGVSGLSRATELGVETVAGFALGALPLRWRDAEALQRYFGGANATKKMWVANWASVVGEILGGRGKISPNVERELFDWRENLDLKRGLDACAASLDDILGRHLSFVSSPIRLSFNIPVTREDVEFLRQQGDGAIQTSCTDKEWRQAWRRLADAAKQDRGRLRLLMSYFFRREGWTTDPRTAMGRLLKAARKGVALKYGGRLPLAHGIDGVATTAAANNGVPVIHRWLAGETAPNESRRGARIGSRSFTEQARRLMEDVGIPIDERRSLIAAAVFETNGWKFDVSDAHGVLRMEVGMRIIDLLGGWSTASVHRDEVNDRFTYEAYRRESIIDSNDKKKLAKAKVREKLLKQNYFRTNDIALWLKGQTTAMSRDEFYQYLFSFLDFIGASGRDFLPLIADAALQDLREAESSKIQNSCLAALTWIESERPGTVEPLRWIDQPDPNHSDDRFEHLELRRALNVSLATLTWKERMLCALRFGMDFLDDKNYGDIGQRFEVSYQRASQIVAKALAKMSHPVKSRRLVTFVQLRENPAFQEIPEERIASLLARIPPYEPLHAKLMIVKKEDDDPLQEWELARRVLAFQNLHPELSMGERSEIALFQCAEHAARYGVRNRNFLPFQTIVDMVALPYGKPFALVLARQFELFLEQR